MTWNATFTQGFKCGKWDVGGSGNEKIGFDTRAEFKNVKKSKDMASTENNIIALMSLVALCGHFH